MLVTLKKYIKYYVFLNVAVFAGSFIYTLASMLF